jgi:hypothetical protein
MNKGLKIGLFAGGGLLAFAFAYVTFALVLGVQPHEIPLVGKAFPAPAEPEKAKDETPTPAAAPSEPKAAPQTASVGLLDVFQVESPYSAKELETLVADLKRKSKEFDQRMLELGERERRAAERSEFLDEQYAQLQRLRTGLEEWENELEQRQAEVQRNEKARAEREAESWAKLGKLFAEGDPADQGKKLAAYTPEQAARILVTMKPARAKELLDNVGADKWKEFADAYRMAGDGGN